MRLKEANLKHQDDIAQEAGEPASSAVNEGSEEEAKVRGWNSAVIVPGQADGHLFKPDVKQPSEEVIIVQIIRPYPELLSLWDDENQL